MTSSWLTSSSAGDAWCSAHPILISSCFSLCCSLAARPTISLGLGVLQSSKEKLHSACSIQLAVEIHGSKQQQAQKKTLKQTRNRTQSNVRTRLNWNCQLVMGGCLCPSFATLSNISDRNRFYIRATEAKCFQKSTLMSTCWEIKIRISFHCNITARSIE